jgi:hypothetical protein
MASLHTNSIPRSRHATTLRENERRKGDGVILCPTGSNGTALSDMKMKPPLRAKSRWFAVVGALEH